MPAMGNHEADLGPHSSLRVQNAVDMAVQVSCTCMSCQQVAMTAANLLIRVTLHGHQVPTGQKMTASHHEGGAAQTTG